MSENRTTDSTMEYLSGLSASPGMSQGQAVVHLAPNLSFQPYSVTEVEKEVARLDAAVIRAIREVERLKRRVLAEMGEEYAHIFRSQQTILEDEGILAEIRSRVTEFRWCAEEGVRQVFAGYLEMFAELQEGDYNKERMADLEDVHNRLLRILLGKKGAELADLSGPSIIVARELYPSDTALMDRDMVAGLVTERGGITSHVAILAKNLGIPAAVAVSDATRRVRSSDSLYLDTTDLEEARVYVNPGAPARRLLEERRERYEERRKLLAAERHLPPVTPDGRKIAVSANIGSLEEIDKVLEAGARSIGLFRSEFLFMKGSRLPEEETQFRAYKRVVGAFTQGHVVLRSLDVGGDKPLQSIPIPPQENPFLGYRAVRVSLDHPTLFRQQLRAALRASAFGNLKVMFPMISGPNEVVRILALLEELREELDREGVEHDRELEVGVMVEVPSAVLMAEEILRLVDFMSIGTNDLTQYLLAADRMNETIREYYQPYHPAVFRAIARVVDAAHARGKQVGICGELAGMPPSIPVLIGLGVDELSMSAQMVAEAIHVIRHTRYDEATELAREVLSMDEEAKIKALLQRIRKE
jgi:phosphotransferase system enzyme I (PtsI)